jgi:hypothetical protein
MKKKIGTQNLKMFREQLFPIFFLVGTGNKHNFIFLIEVLKLTLKINLPGVVSKNKSVN